MKVLAAFTYFEGSFIPSSIEDAQLGFAASDLYIRRSAWRSLFRVMMGWANVTAMSEETLDVVGRLTRPTGYTEQDIVHAAKLLAFHYVRSFTSVFNRAPILPHGL